MYACVCTYIAVASISPQVNRRPADIQPTTSQLNFDNCNERANEILKSFHVRRDSKVVTAADVSTTRCTVSLGTSRTFSVVILDCICFVAATFQRDAENARRENAGLENGGNGIVWNTVYYLCLLSTAGCDH